jgi:hypothetical protein
MSTGARGSEYSTWRGQDVVLWAGPIDPSKNYTMVLKTLLSNWWIDISKVKTWSALDESKGKPPTDDASGSTKKSTPIGAIVGGVVGGVVALLALGFLLWFMRRRKRARVSPLDILDRDDTPIETKDSPTHVT